MPVPSSPLIDDADRLASLDRYDVLDTEPERAFEDIVEIARHICKTPVALVSFVTASRQWFKAKVGVELAETPIEQSVCAHVVAEQDLLVIPDLSLDPRTMDNQLVTGEPHIRFYAGAPLVAPDGHVLGSLCVIDGSPRAEGLTAEQADALGALARQVIRELELRHALHELERQNASALWSAQRLEFALSAGRGIGTWDWDVENDRVTADARFAQLYGIDPEEAAMGATFEKFLKNVHPDDLGCLQQAIHEALEFGKPFSAEYRLLQANGSFRWVLARGECNFTPEGKPLRFPGVSFDISERKTTEERQAALLRLGDLLRADPTEGDAVQAAAEALGPTLYVTRGGYARIEFQTGTMHVEGEWTAPGARSLIGTHSLAAFKTSLDHLKKGETLAVSNISAATWLQSDAPAYREFDIHSQLMVPLLSGADLVGMLFAQCEQPRTWTQTEIDFLHAVADRLYAFLSKRQAEENQRLLNDELSHRLKNMLALVQSVATQTLRHIPDRTALDAFQGRLQSLSKAHEILLDRNWDAAPIRSVIENVLRLHGGFERFHLSGPDLKLGAKAVLSCSLLLHELATNAIKYGSLSVETGKVFISWSIGDATPAIFTLSWEERGGPSAFEPARTGFGSRLIKMGLVGSGNVDLHYKPSGFAVAFRAPLSLMREEGIASP